MNNLARFKIDPIILNALNEDITYEDLSTRAIYMGEADPAKVELLGRADGVIAGLEVFERVFQLLDKDVRVEFHVEDGDRIKDNQLLATVYASVQTLLSGERVALNFLQRISGIATYTRQVADLLEGTDIRIADSRKTAPGLRIFEKYAVRVGGGINHRYNLSDAVMLKDNHINAAGGVQEAIRRAQEYTSFTHKIEVEVETLEMVREAAEAGADIIMLDNMNLEQMQEAVEVINGRAIIEISGNMTRENIERYRVLDIDIISSGALTHSAGILDLSMKNLTIL